MNSQINIRKLDSTKDLIMTYVIQLLNQRFEICERFNFQMIYTSDEEIEFIKEKTIALLSQNYEEHMYHNFQHSKLVPLVKVITDQISFTMSDNLKISMPFFMDAMINAIERKRDVIVELQKESLYQITNGEFVHCRKCNLVLKKKSTVRILEGNFLTCLDCEFQFDE